MFRLKSLDILDKYEFDSDEISNDPNEKVVTQKDKKQREDEKFRLFVHMHDFLRYGK